MKTKQIFTKTMKFIWIKLGLGLLTVLISAALLGILTLIGISTKSSGVLLICLTIWGVATAWINFAINHYVGYLVKAGHIAVIQQAITTGQIPENQIQVGKEMVMKRFGTSNVYFVVDKLVSGAVKQLQHGLQKVDNLLGNIPGVSFIVSFAQVFVGIALGYVDECCLAYTFYKKEDTSFKSAADGVVIYFQNWKTLLKSAAATTAFVMIGTVLAWVVPFLILNALFAALGWATWISIIISIMLALTIKSAFIDSYMLIRTMNSYMQVAPTTQITFNLYEKLCKLSNKFKELFKKAESSDPSIANHSVSQPIPVAVTNESARYCPHCGNPVTGAFCSKCGKQL